MSTLKTTVNYLPSWTESAAPPIRTCDEDGTHHFSTLKKLALSGTQYLHACNSEFEPTRDMLIGTVAHLLILGERPGAKPVVLFDGDARRGKAWETFKAEHEGAEIVTAPEWAEANAIAAAVRWSPVACARLKGARFEVPLVWEEDGLKFSTSGIDIVCPSGDIGDLKTTASTQPETWMRQAFRMMYPQQLAFYRRGARANGIQVRGLFCLGVERKAPHEVVELELTERLIDFADRSVTLWIEKLKGYRQSIPEPRTVYDWPGYAQSPMPWDLPSWAQDDEEDGDEVAA